MGKVVMSMVVLSFLSACNGGLPPAIGGQGRYEVYGVDDNDMLKMRAGPGVGFDVYAGLPNGAVVRSLGCERLGHTRWCKVALDRAPGLVGYVSQAYLREL